MGLADEFGRLATTQGGHEVFLEDIIGGSDDPFAPTVVSDFTDRIQRSGTKINLNTGITGSGISQPVAPPVVETPAESSTFLSRLNEGKLEGRDVLGLSFASTAFKTASAFNQIQSDGERAMKQMQSEFDLAFGSKEFDFRMNQARMNSRAIVQMIQSVSSIQKQGADVSAQGVGRQSQVFLRNPVTGASV